jgi:hypothetical protein
MSKKLYLLTVVLLIVPMILTACGDDKKEDKKDNAAVNLSQSYTSTTYSLTVKYPEGWVASDGDSAVNIGNSQAAIDVMAASNDVEIPAGSFGVQVMAIPLAEIGMADQSVADVLKAMSASMSSDTTHVGDVKDVKVGGKDGARVDITDDKQKADGFVIGFKLDDNTLIMVAGMAAKGELDKNEATALKIAESVAVVPAQ